METANPNIKVRIPYICPKTNEGIAVDADEGANEVLETLAMCMVEECEGNGGCGDDCPVRLLAEGRT